MGSNGANENTWLFQIAVIGVTVVAVMILWWLAYPFILRFKIDAAHDLSSIDNSNAPNGANGQNGAPAPTRRDGANGGPGAAAPSAKNGGDGLAGTKGLKGLKGGDGEPGDDGTHGSEGIPGYGLVKVREDIFNTSKAIVCYVNGTPLNEHLDTLAEKATKVFNDQKDRLKIRLGSSFKTVLYQTHFEGILNLITEGSVGNTGGVFSNGTVDPNGSVSGNIGDYYIKTGSPAYLFGPKLENANLVWPIIPKMFIEILLNGIGAPLSSPGAIGNFYIDTASNVLYGPKLTTTGNPWPLTGITLNSNYELDTHAKLNTFLDIVTTAYSSQRNTVESVRTFNRTQSELFTSELATLRNYRDLDMAAVDGDAYTTGVRYAKLFPLLPTGNTAFDGSLNNLIGNTAVSFDDEITNLYSLIPPQQIIYNSPGSTAAQKTAALLEINLRSDQINQLKALKEEIRMERINSKSAIQTAYDNGGVSFTHFTVVFNDYTLGGGAIALKAGIDLARANIEAAVKACSDVLDALIKPYKFLNII
jgi:hypothetical protein